MTDFPQSDCYGDARFTTNDPGDMFDALAICDTCTFRACKPILRGLSLAERQNLEGVWDGKAYTPSTNRVQVKPITHGTTHGARIHRGRGERPCEDCRLAETRASAIKRARKRVAA